MFIPFVFRIHSIVLFDNLLYPACSLSLFSALPEWIPFLVIIIMYLLLFTLICSVFFSIRFMNRYVHKTGYLIICGSSFYFIVLVVWWFNDAFILISLLNEREISCFLYPYIYRITKSNIPIRHTLLTTSK